MPAKCVQFSSHSSHVRFLFISSCGAGPMHSAIRLNCVIFVMWVLFGAVVVLGQCPSPKWIFTQPSLDARRTTHCFLIPHVVCLPNGLPAQPHQNLMRDVVQYKLQMCPISVSRIWDEISRKEKKWFVTTHLAFTELNKMQTIYFRSN